MAGSSASTNINANSGGKFYVAVSWSETGTSTANNTSTISVTGTIGQRQSGEAFWSGNVKAGQLSVYWHDNNTGTDQWVTNLNVWEIGYDQASRSVTGSVTATHKSDGTLSGYAKATWVKDPSGVPYYAPNDGTAETDWVALTTIPRASTPTITPSTFSVPATSGTLTINTNRASSSFTHTITLKIGNTTIATKTNVGSSTTINLADISNSILQEIPNATSASITVTCVTYSGSTNIGTKTKTITANVSNDAAPTFSDFTFADTNATTTAITGNNSVMISGKSTITATISAANKATPRLSATMDKYTFAVADLFTDESYSESAITKTLGSPTVANTELPSATRDLTVSAIDSRGISTTVTKAITIVPYQAPIVNATAKRVNGFENDTTIKISGSFSRIEVGGTAKNTVNSSTGVKYRYKAQSTSTWGNWTNKTATVDAATGSVTVADFTLSLDNQASYDIEVQITDKLETTIVSLVVAMGQPAFFIGSDGRVSIGEMPTISKLSGEKGILEVAGRAFANGHQLAELPIDSTNVNFDNFTSNHYDFVKIFEYNQTSASSSDVTVTVPIDLTDATGYKEIIIESAHEPYNTNTIKWISIGARTESGTSNISCQQRGMELNPSGAWITRDANEVIACGASSWASSHFWLRIIRSAGVNYPTFMGFGIGGDPGYAQIMQGRIKAGANSVKKIRIQLATPQSGGWVRAYARK